MTTSNLVKSISIAKTAEVASHMDKPSLSFGIQSALGTHTPEVVPFHVKTTSLLKFTFERSGNSPYVLMSWMVTSSNFNCLVISFTQVKPKDSQPHTSTPLAPKRLHMAISIAPVSEAGTIPTK